MFSKLLITSVLGTTLIGGGAATGLAPDTALPSALEFAAGPLRVETGGGQAIQAHMASHSRLTLTMKLGAHTRLQIKF